MGPSILTRTHFLEDGPPVRLRLARTRDEEAVRDLLTERGVEAAYLDVRRLLSFDPATRMVLCACALVDARERLVGVAAIDLRPDADVDTLVVDEPLAPGLGGLLVDALRTQAQARARRAA